jgi:hypothetical protein
MRNSFFLCSILLLEFMQQEELFIAKEEKKC